MISLMKKRDKWENNLGALKEQEQLFYNKMGFYKNEYKVRLQKYKEWLEEVKIEPYKIKFDEPPSVN